MVDYIVLPEFFMQLATWAACGFILLFACVLVAAFLGALHCLFRAVWPSKATRMLRKLRGY